MFSTYWLFGYTVGQARSITIMQHHCCHIMPQTTLLMSPCREVMHWWKRRNSRTDKVVNLFGTSDALILL
uniref:Uncharacterized protein n=1 Tax=Meloidogyne incognita TaxID=6306 RepID=A0A914LCL5_MELIC